MTNKQDLAIVIPAYKEAFFYFALQSLANQTNKNFKVYIGDDCSPFDLKKIVDLFSKDLKIVYQKFAFNIGPKDLVNQWTRCIELTENEEWLWLFSDDDIAEANCVEQFFKTICEKNDRFDVYRFNTCVINDRGETTHDPVIGPAVESSEEMAYNLLLGKRGNSMPDHIFSRKVYNDSGRFVFTKFAQSADWAASILFSKDKGICIISKAKIFWRKSELNISSVTHDNRGEMIEGYKSFLTWLNKHFEYLDYKRDSNVTRQMIQEASWINFKHLLQYHYKGFDKTNLFRLVKFAHDQFGTSIAKAFKELFQIIVFWENLKIRKRLSMIKRFLFYRKS